MIRFRVEGFINLGAEYPSPKMANLSIMVGFYKPQKGHKFTLLWLELACLTRSQALSSASSLIMKVETSAAMACGTFSVRGSPR